MKKSLIILAILAILAIALQIHIAPYPGRFVIFEDGSFILGDLAGCVPLTPCW